MARRSKNAYVFAPERSVGSRYGCLILLLIFLAIAVAAVVVISLSNNSQIAIETEKVTIWGLESGLENTAILHLSDLHGAEFKTSVLQALGKKNYQAAVLTGDMVGQSGNYQPLLDLIAQLRPNVPVLFIAGDSDPEPILSTAHGSPSVYNDWVQAAIDAGAIYLDAPYALETASGRTLWFCPEHQYSLDANSAQVGYEHQRNQIISSGLVNTPDGAARLRALDYYSDVILRLEAARKAMKEKDLQILVSHYPLTQASVHDLADYTSQNVMTLSHVDLALAGHYCGGQWRLPFADKALYIPHLGWFPAQELYTGLNWVGSIPQNISDGLGASDYYSFMPGRVFNKPAVTLISLTSKAR